MTLKYVVKVKGHFEQFLLIHVLPVFRFWFLEYSKKALVQFTLLMIALHSGINGRLTAHGVCTFI